MKLGRLLVFHAFTAFQPIMPSRTPRIIRHYAISPCIDDTVTVIMVGWFHHFHATVELPNGVTNAPTGLSHTPRQPGQSHATPHGLYLFIGFRSVTGFAAIDTASPRHVNIEATGIGWPPPSNTLESVASPPVNTTRQPTIDSPSSVLILLPLH